jgi:hypothetical protein
MSATVMSWATFLRFHAWPRSRISAVNPAGAIGAAVRGPRVAQLVRVIRVVEVGVGDRGAAAVDPVVER